MNAFWIYKHSCELSPVFKLCTLWQWFPWSSQREHVLRTGWRTHTTSYEQNHSNKKNSSYVNYKFKLAPSTNNNRIHRLKLCMPFKFSINKINISSKNHITADNNGGLQRQHNANYPAVDWLTLYNEIKNLFQISLMPCPTLLTIVMCGQRAGIDDKWHRLDVPPQLHLCLSVSISFDTIRQSNFPLSMFPDASDYYWTDSGQDRATAERVERRWRKLFATNEVVHFCVHRQLRYSKETTKKQTHLTYVETSFIKQLDNRLVAVIRRQFVSHAQQATRLIIVTWS